MRDRRELFDKVEPECDLSDIGQNDETENEQTWSNIEVFFTILDGDSPS